MYIQCIYNQFLKLNLKVVYPQINNINTYTPYIYINNTMLNIPRYKCECKGDWRGIHCSVLYNAICLRESCLNGGICELEENVRLCGRVARWG